METDPVCGMEVNKLEAAPVSDCMGTRFYFCSESCKRVFEEDPERYAGIQEARQSR
jgi:P-type Cu+ transporter